MDIQDTLVLDGMAYPVQLAQLGVQVGILEEVVQVDTLLDTLLGVDHQP